MIPEATLTAILLIVFLADLFTAPRSGESKVRSWFNPLVCVLMLAHVFINIFPTASATAFGGMYMTNPSVGVIKTILAFGTLIVLIQRASGCSAQILISRKESSTNSSSLRFSV